MASVASASEAQLLELAGGLEELQQGMQSLQFLANSDLRAIARTPGRNIYQYPLAEVEKIGERVTRGIVRAGIQGSCRWTDKEYEVRRWRYRVQAAWRLPIMIADAGSGVRKRYFPLTALHDDRLRNGGGGQSP